MPRISSQTIDAAINATDFVSLVENYTKLQRRGATWWGCCPFHHEKTPSFQINPEKKLYYCFGCHKGGNMVNFLMEVEHLSFTEAITVLAKQSGTEIIYDNKNAAELSEADKLKQEMFTLYTKAAQSFHHILLHTKEGQGALEYLDGRHVSRDIIESFQLGLAPANRKWLYQFLKKNGYQDNFLKTCGLFSTKYPTIAFFSNRIMFPISNRHGQVIAFGGRTLSDDPKSPKYLNSSDLIHYQKKYNLFALHKALQSIRTEKKVIICEGYMDVLAYHQADITYAVAPLGTALTDEQINIIAPLTETVYLSFDSDEAGTNATLRAIQMCNRHDLTVKVIQITGAKDPAEVLEKNGPAGLKKIIENSILDREFFVQKAMVKYDVLTAEGKEQACKFLFPFLNSITSRVKREDIIFKTASKLAVSPKALYADFMAGEKDTAMHPNAVGIPENAAAQDVVLNAETRAVLAAVSDPAAFKQMRSQLTSDDFHDTDAKTIFILLEECYREGVEGYNELLKRCTDERLKQAITRSVTSEEFSRHTKEIIEDSIRQIRKNNILTQRNNLVNRIRELSVQGTPNTMHNELNDLFTDIADLDEQLKDLGK